MWLLLNYSQSLCGLGLHHLRNDLVITILNKDILRSGEIYREVQLHQYLRLNLKYVFMDYV